MHTSGRYLAIEFPILRVTTAVRLQRDLGVNLPGVALALDLMDELMEYRRRS